MNLGIMELLLILLVAFVFLGPERMIEAARTLGRTVGYFRRTMTELTQIGLEEPEERHPGYGATAVAKDSKSEDEVQPLPYQRKQPTSKEGEGDSPPEGGNTS